MLCNTTRGRTMCLFSFGPHTHLSLFFYSFTVWSWTMPWKLIPKRIHDKKLGGFYSRGIPLLYYKWHNLSVLRLWKQGCNKHKQKKNYYRKAWPTRAARESSCRLCHCIVRKRYIKHALVIVTNTVLLFVLIRCNHCHGTIGII